MRRVSVANARPGMVLGRAVYDTRGRLVLGEGDRLIADSLETLARAGAAEILIEDPRVADVPVGSLFSAQVEAKVVQALHVMLVTHEGTTEGIGSPALLAIQPWVRKMAERLFPEILGEPDLSWVASLQGYDYIHPVKTAGLSMLLGRFAELGPEDLVKLGMAAMDEISFFARIIALADTYHALLSKRPHRAALKPHEAVEFIVAYSGESFDPELTQIFARRTPQYPAGLVVRLSTGEVGIVSNPNAGHIARPVVRICYEDGNAVQEPYDLNLSERECMTKLIVEVLL